MRSNIEKMFQRQTADEIKIEEQHDRQRRIAELKRAYFYTLDHSNSDFEKGIAELNQLDALHDFLEDSIPEWTKDIESAIDDLLAHPNKNKIAEAIKQFALFRKNLTSVKLKIAEEQNSKISKYALIIDELLESINHPGQEQNESSSGLLLPIFIENPINKSSSDSLLPSYKSPATSENKINSNNFFSISYIPNDQEITVAIEHFCRDIVSHINDPKEKEKVAKLTKDLLTELTTEFILEVTQEHIISMAIYLKRYMTAIKKLEIEDCRCTILGLFLFARVMLDDDLMNKKDKRDYMYDLATCGEISMSDLCKIERIIENTIDFQFFITEDQFNQYKMDHGIKSENVSKQASSR
jgi:hypothetical protein